MSKAYTQYIVEHCANVKKAYDWLVDHKIISDKYLHRLHTHDLSKYGDEEYAAYDKYFYGKQGKTPEVKEAFNFAWLHHIHNNPHHWQHWVLINDDDGTHALEMPEEYVVEMICDWWSFSHKTENLEEIFSWYDSHKSNMIMHKNTKARVEDILKQIKSILKEEAKHDNS
jgi:hypothetical protein